MRERCGMHIVRVDTCLSKIFILLSLRRHALCKIVLLLVLFGLIVLNIAVVFAAVLGTLFSNPIL